MRILIMGAGKMGAFLCDALSFQHEIAVYDVDAQRLRFVYNTYRFTSLDEIRDFRPELLINAVTVKYTIEAFEKVLPYLPKDCIISDIASVKTGLGKVFFKDFYHSLKLNIFEYSFDEHDETVAYSLSIPFVSTLVFSAVMKHQEAPGTTFKKHMAIAKALLGEDDYLLQEILFNPRTPAQVENIRLELKHLLEIISNKDAEAMKSFLTDIRRKIQ